MSIKYITIKKGMGSDYISVCLDESQQNPKGAQTIFKIDLRSSDLAKDTGKEVTKRINSSNAGNLVATLLSFALKCVHEGEELNHLHFTSTTEDNYKLTIEVLSACKDYVYTIDSPPLGGLDFFVGEAIGGEESYSQHVPTNILNPFKASAYSIAMENCRRLLMATAL